MRQILAARKQEPAADTMETLPFDPLPLVQTSSNDGDSEVPDWTPPKNPVCRSLSTELRMAGKDGISQMGEGGNIQLGRK